MEKVNTQIENMEPLFSVLKQPHRIYRYNTGGGRLYFRIDEYEEPRLYLSVTTFIKRSMPTPEQLIKWIADMGYDKAKEYTELRANFGTFEHTEFARVLTTGVCDLDGMSERLANFIETERWPGSYMSWLEEMQRDVIALSQFVIDYEVEPIAIEMVLCSDKYRFAGAIDLVCWLKIEETGYFGEVYKSGPQKGQSKESKKKRRVLAIIDLKSGKKGFRDEHVIQLQAYRVLWEENFPNMKIEKVFNLAPKDWRTAPSYLITDQTDKFNVGKMQHMLALAEIDELNPNRMITIYKGSVSLKSGNLQPLFKTMSFADRIRELKQQELDQKAELLNTENQQ